MSEAAIALKKAIETEGYRTIKERNKIWNGITVLEHCQPIAEVWRLAKEKGGALNVFTLFSIIGEYPPVVVKKEEDDLINSRYRDSGHPDERYRDILVSFSLSTKAWMAVWNEEICDQVRELFETWEQL
jgi:hypothetical protein